MASPSASGDRAVNVNETSSSNTTNSSSNGTSSSSVDAGDAGKTTSSNVGDSCTWYDDGDCTWPRSCRDCLNVLLSTDSCAVDPNGACVSMSEYESYLANRYYYTPMQRYFPSSEYSYCSANDSVCASCTQEWNADSATTSSWSYCTGTDGCVCIADCEVADWQMSVIDDQCLVTGSASGSNSGTSMATRITVSIFVGIAVAVMLAFATWGVRRFVHRWSNDPDAIRREVRTIPRPPPTGPQLTLTGWKSLRQNLIESENGFVHGEAVTLQRSEERPSGAVETAPETRVEQGESSRPATLDDLERGPQEAAQRDRTAL